MRSFWRTVAGKTTLFLSTVLCTVLFAVSIIGFSALISTSAYMLEKHDYRNQLMCEFFSSAMENIVNAYVEDPKTDLDYDYVLKDSDGNVLKNTVSVDVGSDPTIEKIDMDYFVFEEDGSKRLTPAYYAGTTTKEGSYNVTLYLTSDAYLRRHDTGDFFWIRFLIGLYDFKNTFFFSMVFSFLAVVILTVSIMTVSGRRPNDTKVYPGSFNGMPFDFMVGMTSIPVLLMMLFMALVSKNFDSLTMTLITSTICFVIFVSMLLGLAMSFAVRVKTRTFIKNNITYKIINGTYRFIKWCFYAIPMSWAAIIFLFFFFLIQGIVLVEEEINLWFFSGIIFCLIIVYCVTCFVRLYRSGKKIASGDTEYKVNTKGMVGQFKKHGEDLNNISEGINRAVNEKMKSERMKTELITNVSHDIKTPLTSIINYAGLLGTDNIEPEKTKEYSQVLVNQSVKLKRLIEDLVEASKASTGNLEVNLVELDACTFISQVDGEYDEKIAAAGLELITSAPEEPVPVMADGRRMWRIFDNLMNNICKYSQTGTRVYISLEEKEGQAVITFKNTSKEPLNISPDELMERFVRGDSSRNTEGNGLGLSIAKSLTELQNGTFNLEIDGDLFKAILKFDVVKNDIISENTDTAPQN